MFTGVTEVVISRWFVDASSSGRARASDGRDFALKLPLGPVAGRPTPPTHVVELRGDRGRFMAALARAVAGSEDVAARLSGPVTSLGAVADTLNAVGDAVVQSIDPAMPALATGADAVESVEAVRRRGAALGWRE